MASRRYLENDEIIADINVIPLVDISLVLLIIFMVTANYLTTYLNIKLPEAKYVEETTVSAVAFATVTVTREGPIYLENKLVTMDELKDKLKERSKKDPKLGVVLNVDKRANFGNAVTVLDMLRSINIPTTDITTVEGER